MMQRENLDDKEILSKIDDSISQMDGLRLSELNSLKRIQEIKHAIYQLEAERLIKKYDHDHPRILKLKQRMEYSKELFVGLDKEIEKTSIKAEKFVKNSWRVHGRVFDKENKPLKSQTVFFSDSNGKWIEAIGSSCSTETGYYSLTMDEKLFERIEKGQSLFLTVSDKSQKPVFISKEPLYPSKGIIIFRDIFLDDDDCSLPTVSNIDIGRVAKTNKEKK